MRLSFFARLYKSTGGATEVLCCTIPTLLNDLEIKVMDLEKNHIEVFGYRFWRQSVIQACDLYYIPYVPASQNKKFDIRM